MSDSRFFCKCGGPAVWEVQVAGHSGSSRTRCCTPCKDIANDDHSANAAQWSFIATPINRHIYKEAEVHARQPQDTDRSARRGKRRAHQ